MKTLTCLLFLLFCTATFAFIYDEDIEYVVDVKINNEEDIVDLTRRGFSLEHASVHTKRVEAYATKEELKILKEMGLLFDAVPNEIQMERRSPRSKRDVGGAQYHHYDQLTEFLNNMATTYPEITKVISVGKSVQGRNLWAMEISRNAGVNEAEPEFKYIANMHGDEAVGREMCIYLIELLCSNYNKDNSSLSQRITTLINTVDIFIVPTMNPDGFERGTRGNANYKDLNRDFPDQWTSNHNDGVGRQPETVSVMNFVSSRHFALSANFHGGSVVANYPYDGNKNYRSGVDTPAPDDAVFRTLATTYSQAHTTMHNSYEFTGGITNGADWYVLYGGMQDWNYLWNGVFEITIELSDNKYPPASQLAGFWDQNKEAMLAYMELVNSMGVRGIVTDASTGNPLDATISVSGINHDVSTDPANGDYYRLLTAGTYTITVSANGYSSQSATVVVPEKQTAQIVQNFAL